MQPENQAPIFPSPGGQQLKVGQQFRLIIRPRDPEGFAPILHVQNSPAASIFEDRGDGSRELIWTPQPDDVGDRYVRFVAIDYIDATLSSELIIKLAVQP